MKKTLLPPVILDVIEEMPKGMDEASRYAYVLASSGKRMAFILAVMEEQGIDDTEVREYLSYTMRIFAGLLQAVSPVRFSTTDFDLYPGVLDQKGLFGGGIDKRGPDTESN